MVFTKKDISNPDLITDVFWLLNQNHNENVWRVPFNVHLVPLVSIMFRVAGIFESHF